jgi:hypothetical protein
MTRPTAEHAAHRAPRLKVIRLCDARARPLCRVQGARVDREHRAVAMRCNRRPVSLREGVPTSGNAASPISAAIQPQTVISARIEVANEAIINARLRDAVSLTDVPVARDNVLVGGQFTKAAGPACVELIGTDTDFSAQAEFESVVKARARIDHDGR